MVMILVWSNVWTGYRILAAVSGSPAPSGAPVPSSRTHRPRIVHPARHTELNHADHHFVRLQPYMRPVTRIPDYRTLPRRDRHLQNIPDRRLCAEAGGNVAVSWEGGGWEGE